MEAPLQIILDMIMVVFGNTIGTLSSLAGLFGSLTQSLAGIGSSGPLGFVLAAGIFGVALYFLGKFFLNSWKLIAMLFVAGIVLIWFLIGF